MKIYTKTGDHGETSLFDGSRVSKCDERIEALGELDELSAHLALAHDWLEHPLLKRQIQLMIKNLFQISGHIAGSTALQDLSLKVQITNLESLIDRLEGQLPPLINFIYQFGHQSVSQLHIARVVCRRVERHLLTILLFSDDHAQIAPYLNRLSDALFIMARFVAQELAVPEVLMLNS